MGLSLVLDATPLIYLSRVGFWRVAEPLDYSLFTTELVLGELRVPQAPVGELAALEELIRSKRLSVRRLDVRSPVEGLSPADVSVVKLAQKLGAVAVLDDGLARHYARASDVKTVFSSSLLVDAVRRGALNQKTAAGFLDAMISGGWFCSISAYKAILRSFEEAENR